MVKRWTIIQIFRRVPQLDVTHQKGEHTIFSSLSLYVDFESVLKWLSACKLLPIPVKWETNGVGSLCKMSACSPVLYFFPFGCSLFCCSFLPILSAWNIRVRHEINEVKVFFHPHWLVHRSTISDCNRIQRQFNLNIFRQRRRRPSAWVCLCVFLRFSCLNKNTEKIIDRKLIFFECTKPN